MVGKYNRDTSSVTATPSTVTSSSAAFGRWAFGIGQLRRDRRGRTGIVKGRSVRSGGNVLTTLSCSASGIFAICCDLTRPTITRLARTFQSTRTRRCREQYVPLVAFCLRHFLADSIIGMCVFDFRQAQLYWHAHSLIVEQGRADITCRRGSGAHSVPSDPGWTASPICSGLICGRHNYPGHSYYPASVGYGPYYDYGPWQAIQEPGAARFYRPYGYGWRPW